MPKKTPSPAVKPKRGRQTGWRKEINLELLKRMAMRHSRMEEMADCLGCHVDTLRDNYFQIISQAKAQGKLELRDYQWRMVEKNSAQMGIWLGRAILKQNEDAGLSEDQTSNLTNFTSAIDKARQKDEKEKQEDDEE